jgi:hypothetical protein
VFIAIKRLHEYFVMECRRDIMPAFFDISHYSYLENSSVHWYTRRTSGYCRAPVKSSIGLMM